MNNLKFIINKLLATIFIAVVIVGCDDDDDAPKAFELTSAAIGSKDLIGATFATDVATTDNITLVFTDNVAESTANSDHIILMQGDNVIETGISVSGNTVTVDPTNDLISGTQYSFEVTSGLTSTSNIAYSGLTTSFTTAGLGIDTAPQADNQTLYVQFNNGIEDVLGNATVSSQQVAFTADRFGNANGAADFRGATAAGNGDIVELSGDQSTFINPSMSFSIWFEINPDNYIAPGNKPMLGLAAERGYFFEMGDGEEGPNWIKFTTNHIIEPDPQNHNFGNAWGDFGTTDGGQAISDLITGNWHHLVMTYDSDTYEKTIYLDGVKVKTWTLRDDVEWNLKDITINEGTGVDIKLTLGYFASKDHTATGWVNYATATNTFIGALDDLRIWDGVLSAGEVTALYDSEKP